MQSYLNRNVLWNLILVSYGQLYTHKPILLPSILSSGLLCSFTLAGRTLVLWEKPVQLLCKVLQRCPNLKGVFAPTMLLLLSLSPGSS